MSFSSFPMDTTKGFIDLCRNTKVRDKEMWRDVDGSISKRKSSVTSGPRSSISFLALPLIVLSWIAASMNMWEGQLPSTWGNDLLFARGSTIQMNKNSGVSALTFPFCFRLETSPHLLLPLWRSRAKELLFSSRRADYSHAFCHRHYAVGWLRR